MSSTGDVALAALDIVTMQIVDSVGAIRPSQRGAATPCSGWDLTALIEHLTGGNWFTAMVLAGGRAEDALAATRKRFGDRSATTEDALQSLAEQVEGFRKNGVLDRTCNHVVGDITGRQVLRLRLHDLIVHSWDIEEALQPGATVAAQQRAVGGGFLS